MTEINNISKEILKQLQFYASGVEEEVEKGKKETAKELVRELKRSSPKKSGKYAKGWTVKRQGKSYVVHNKNEYMKTHLLEHGHAKKNGGRVEGKAHIRPAEERAINDFLEKIERALKT